MGKAREFTTMPARAIADTRLSGLELRSLMAIALHDGMSTKRENAAGCYAKRATLAAIVRTDITNFSKAVSRLTKLGYVVSEAQQTDKRRTTLRVIYGDDDSWRDDQQFGAEPASEIVGEATNYCEEIVGEATNHHNEKVGETTKQIAKLVGDREHLSDEIISENSAKYTPLRGEIDFVETNKINSVETAHLADREKRLDGQEFSSDFIDEVFGDTLPRKKIDRAEARATNGVSLYQHLGRSFPNLAEDAQLAKFEQALARIDRRFDLVDSRERKQWLDWLFALNDDFADSTTGHRALRLLTELDVV